MIKIYPYEKLGHNRMDWLDTRYHFSFAEYHNPARMGFGALRVINDDIVKGGNGFDTHPHKDMEIITYVRSGAISHRDSMDNEGRTEAGDVQVMSAGTGVHHSEFNREDEDTSLFQIWIYPRQKGVKPRWDARKFPKEPVNDRLPLLVSGRSEDAETGALYIHQDASISGGTLKSGTAITQPIRDQAYLVVSEGRISVDGQELKRGDGAEITETDHVEIKALSDAEIVLIDVPPQVK